MGQWSGFIDATRSAVTVYLVLRLLQKSPIEEWLGLE